MTIDEALKKIADLEEENAKLKKEKKKNGKYRVPYPGLSEVFPECAISSKNEFREICSFMRRLAFGTVPMPARIGNKSSGFRIAETTRGKKVSELTDEEYEYFSMFFMKLLALVDETIKGWRTE